MMQILELYKVTYLLPIGVGCIFGICHFIIMNPSSFSDGINFSGLALRHVLCVLILSPIAIFRYNQSLAHISRFSHIETNSIFHVICAACCLFSGLLFFGIIRFRTFDNLFIRRENINVRYYLQHLSNLGLYWFFLNAFLVSMYFELNSRKILLVIVGFLMALALSEVYNQRITAQTKE